MKVIEFDKTDNSVSQTITLLKPGNEIYFMHDNKITRGIIQSAAAYLNGDPEKEPVSDGLLSGTFKVKVIEDQRIMRVEAHKAYTSTEELLKGLLDEYEEE